MKRLLVATAASLMLLAGCSAEDKAGADLATSTKPSPRDVSAEVFSNTGNYSRVEQMDYAGRALNDSYLEDVEDLKDALVENKWGEGHFLDGRLFVQPSVDNTPQEIWDQISTAEFKTWKLAQEGDIEEATKLATAVAEGAEFADLVATFANGGAAVLAVGIGHSDGARPVITSGEYEGMESNGFGLTEFTMEPLATNKYDPVRVVVRFTKGTDPRSGRWVLVKTVPVRPAG
jgi:hypothetical protein